MKKTKVKSLFRYFGGKSFVSAEVWRRLGNPDRYIEPFCGTAAVLFGRPDEHEWWNKGELINDVDGFIVNAFRSLRQDPEQVLHYAVWPKTEIDLHSRLSWLINQEPTLTDKLLGDPFYYDPLIAGWWLWTMAVKISPRVSRPGVGWVQENGRLVRNTDPNRPGIDRAKPAISYPTNYFLPPKVRDISFDEFEQDVRVQWLREFYTAIQYRLSRVNILNGDWKRVFVRMYYSDNVPTGIFLDPPYALDDRTHSLYQNDRVDITEEVRDWAIKHGSLPHFRIAVCGLSNYLDLSEHGWTPHYWIRRGGFENRTGSKSRFKEVIWFSPYCLHNSGDGSLTDTITDDITGDETE